jgi:hypothetical protein
MLRDERDISRPPREMKLDRTPNAKFLYRPALLPNGGSLLILSLVVRDLDTLPLHLRTSDRCQHLLLPTPEPVY